MRSSLDGSNPETIVDTDIIKPGRNQLPPIIMFHTFLAFGCVMQSRDGKSYQIPLFCAPST